MADEDITIRIRARGGRAAQREIEGVEDAVEDLDRANAGVARSTAQAGNAARGTKRHFSAMEVAAGGLRREVRRLDRDQFLMGAAAVRARGEVADWRDEIEKAARAADRSSNSNRKHRRTLDGLHSGFQGIAGDIARARIDIGFTSITLRSIIPIMGAFANNIVANLGKALGVIESIAVAGAGLGAAGAIGLSALGQAAAVTSFAFGDLAQAYGGNEAALKRLGPAQMRFLTDLEIMRPRLNAIREAMSEPLFAGVRRGIQNAQPNFRRIRPLAVGTGRAVGDIAANAGQFLGRAGVGRDFTRLGTANIRILRMMGDAGLHLADALRNILIPAIPLATWLARQLTIGARLIAGWAEYNRRTGRTAQFWREARRDLTLLWNIMRNLAGAVINIFGANDVDGTRTLQNIERITERFERWTASPDVQRNFVAALQRILPTIIADLTSAVATGFVRGMAQGVQLLWQAWLRADIPGKIAIGLLVGFRLGLAQLLGRKIINGVFGGIAERLAQRRAGDMIANSISDSVGGGRMRGIGRSIGMALRIGMRGALLAAIPLTVAITLQEVGDQLTPRPLRESLHRQQNAARRNDPLNQPPGGPSSVFGGALQQFGDAAGAAFGFLKDRLGPEDAGAATRRRPRAHVGTIRNRDRRPVVSVQVNRREIARAVGEEVQRGEDRR